MAKIRQIAYDQTFLEQAALLEKDAPRLDAMLDGVLWEIATHAEECDVVDRTLRIAFTDPFPDAPAMRIFFSITDADTCTLHWIEHLPLDEEDQYL
jgi:hypothetical protein